MMRRVFSLGIAMLGLMGIMGFGIYYNLAPNRPLAFLGMVVSVVALIIVLLVAIRGEQKHMRPPDFPTAA